MTKYKYKIKNLDCANCANSLELALQKIEGLENIAISFMTEKLNFECEENEKEKYLEKIKTIIQKEEPDVEIEEV
ncbi:MAG: heavy-metal-associated domain-containing protein [Bacilli bacterium]|jgi:copper chaperone CopZ|nr:heavy-metal-associated domain-containing protein [Bacilli bacterium]